MSDPNPNSNPDPSINPIFNPNPDPHKNKFKPDPEAMAKHGGMNYLSLYPSSGWKKIQKNIPKIRSFNNEF